MIFSRKINKSNHPKICSFCANWKKHLGIYLDESLKFSYQSNEKISKAIKGIGIIMKLNKALPQHSLIKIYKSFVRPHLDYGDIVYDNRIRKISIKKLKEFNIMLLFQLQVPLMELIRARFTVDQAFNLSNLGFGLGNCVPLRKLKQQVYHNTFQILFHKPIIYIILVQQKMWQYFYSRTDAFKYHFCQYALWKILYWNTQQSKTMLSFRNSLKTGWLIPNLIFHIHIPTGLTLLKRLRVGRIHMNQHKFNRSFRGCANPLSPCILETKFPFDLFLYMPLFHRYPKTFFNGKTSVDENTSNQSDN